MPAHRQHGPFTLRVVPESCTTVLFCRDGGGHSSKELWELDARRMVPSFGGSAGAPVLDIHGAARNPMQPLEWVVRDPESTRQGTRSRQASEQCPTVWHSAERVADAIVLAAGSPKDLRTLNAWGQHIGVSRGALRVWCKAAGSSARSCLDFMRVLRAVVVSQRRSWDLVGLLDVVDQRTLTQLLERGQVRQLCRQGRPSVQQFLARQRYIRNEQLVRAVNRRITNDRTISARSAPPPDLSKSR